MPASLPLGRSGECPARHRRWAKSWGSHRCSPAGERTGLLRRLALKSSRLCRGSPERSARPLFPAESGRTCFGSLRKPFAKPKGIALGERASRVLLVGHDCQDRAGRRPCKVESCSAGRWWILDRFTAHFGASSELNFDERSSAATVPASERTPSFFIRLARRISTARGVISRRGGDRLVRPPCLDQLKDLAAPCRSGLRNRVWSASRSARDRRRSTSSLIARWTFSSSVWRLNGFSTNSTAPDFIARIAIGTSA